MVQPLIQGDGIYGQVKMPRKYVNSQAQAANGNVQRSPTLGGSEPRDCHHKVPQKGP